LAKLLFDCAGGVQAHPAGFYGLYRQFRADMDYDYHVNYTPERQRLQDQIISYWTRFGRSERFPWIIFTAGAMGAGKSRTLHALADAGVDAIGDMVQVGPRALLPEP
jgi:hypothetical protein